MSTDTNRRRLPAVATGLLSALLCGGVVWSHATAQGGGQAPAGKITPWEAMRTATHKVPGRALNANFEFEDGHWIYGVMVVTNSHPKQIKELEINATTGVVGDVETITPEGEAKETASELKSALGKVSGRKAQEAPERE